MVSLRIRWRRIECGYEVLTVCCSIRLVYSRRWVRRNQSTPAAHLATPAHGGCEGVWDGWLAGHARDAWDAADAGHAAEHARATPAAEKWATAGGQLFEMPVAGYGRVRPLALHPLRCTKSAVRVPQLWQARDPRVWHHVQVLALPREAGT